MKAHTPWTEDEDGTIRKLWKAERAAWEATLVLPGRSRNAIIARANRLKLVHPGSHKNARKKKGRPVPDDFIQLAPTKTRAQCCEHWACSHQVLRRWCAETGVTPRSTGKPAIQSTGFYYTPKFHSLTPETIATRAAETLQRNRWPTYKCDEKGRYDPKGTLWRVGNLVLTEDEMLQKAAKYEKQAA